MQNPNPLFPITKKNRMANAIKAAIDKILGTDLASTENLKVSSSSGSDSDTETVVPSGFKADFKELGRTNHSKGVSDSVFYVVNRDELPNPSGFPMRRSRKQELYKPFDLEMAVACEYERRSYQKQVEILNRNSSFNEEKTVGSPWISANRVMMTALKHANKADKKQNHQRNSN